MTPFERFWSLMRQLEDRLDRASDQLEEGVPGRPAWGYVGKQVNGAKQALADAWAIAIEHWTDPDAERRAPTSTDKQTIADLVEFAELDLDTK